MEEHEQAAASHGSGKQIARRHLENAKAMTGEEKVQELTDAVEALLLHLQYVEGEPAMANLRCGSEEAPRAQEPRASALKAPETLDC